MNKYASFYIREYRTKTAGEFLERATPQLVYLASLLATIGAGAYASNKLRSTLKDTPAIPEEKIPVIYKSVGIPENFPTVRYGGTENAFYAGPMIAKHLLTEEPRLKGQLGPAGVKRVGNLGIIAYDPAFNRAGILAHEAGHARMGSVLPWYHPSNVNQTWLRPIGSLLSPVAPLVGIATGMATKSPLYGGLAGLAAGALTSAPTLINELQASNSAEKYLDESRHREATKELNKKVLNRAFATYALAGLLPATLAGAGMGYFASK